MATEGDSVLAKTSRLRLYFIRHGETDWNAEGRIQGSRDIPLNLRGHTQASAAGLILRDLIARDGRRIDALDFVASPLIRARVTMDLVRESLGLPREGYRLDDRLRELGYGEWEGLTLPEMQRRDPGVFEMRGVDKWTTAPPAGETYAALTLRMKDWYDSLTGDTVAVAHGGTMRALTVALDLHTPLEGADFNVRQGVVYVFADGVITPYG